MRKLILVFKSNIVKRLTPCNRQSVENPVATTRLAIDSLLIAMLLSFQVNPVSASTLVIMRLKNEMWVAADSKAIDGNGKEKETPACKIHKVGNWLIGYVGVAGNTKDKWDVERTTISAVRGQESPDLIISKIVRTLDKPVQTSIKSLKYELPDSYRKHIVNGVIFTIVLMRMEKGIACVYGYNIGIPENEDGPLRILSRPFQCPGKQCPEPIDFLYAGYIEAIDKFLEEDRKRTDTKTVDPVELIKGLVILEIIAHPEIVGPPIDVVHMDSKGITWVEKKPECQDATHLPTRIPQKGYRKHH